MDDGIKLRITQKPIFDLIDKKEELRESFEVYNTARTNLLIALGFSKSNQDQSYLNSHPELMRLYREVRDELNLKIGGLIKKDCLKF